MAKPDPNLKSLIDADDLRQRMTALTREYDGDGSHNETRMQVLALLKQVSAGGRKRAEQMLLEDGSGNKCAERLSYLHDEIIRCLYDFAIRHVFRASNLSEGERMAVLAVGGYGRGTLAPGSDLDLLFLLPYKQTALGESVVEYMLYMLWDMGLKVGHATRTMDECIRLSKDDMTIRTAVLEARFLWGERSLFDTLVARFDKEVAKGTAMEFITAKLEERDDRHERSGRSRYLVEPNVKDGKGGLRDLHTLFWIAKYHYGVHTLTQLRKKEVFSKKEFRTFTKAQDFLWSVRCHLHFVTGRAEERLSFDLQPVLAERLGYQDHPGLSAVERFMKHYFLVAKDVGDLTRILCAELEETRAKSVQSITGLLRKMSRRPKKIKGSERFETVNNRIRPIDEELFDEQPAAMLRMFQLAEEKGFLFHPDAMHSIARSLKGIDKSVRLDKAANASFMAVLTSRKTPERTLRKMNETGLLGRFIPDFGKIVAMMQFNMYHHYTVDEHLLQSIGILSEIEHGEMEDEHPLANTIMQDLPHRDVLYVALLLHDIAKGRPEDHSLAGAKIARKMCPRLGLNEAQTELVAWLVEHHLLMSNTAQSRDLNDPRTISDFASVMQSMDRMKALLVLTVCDIKAVGPGVWNGWKGQLLRTLYHETEPMLTGGFTAQPRRQRIAQTRAELLEALTDWEPKEREKLVDRFYDNYLLTVPRQNQLRHLELIRNARLNGETIATLVTPHDFEAITEITIFTPDHPRLLSTIAGCCSAAGANIADAQIFTTKDGMALNSIFVNREFDRMEDERQRAERIASSIRKVLTGEVRMQKLLANRKEPTTRKKAFSVPPVISIKNDLSDKFTVIEVEGLDRLGVLSALTDALADLSLDIATAHIATFGEKFIDTFYVTDLVGHKIERPQKIGAIRRKLMAALTGKPEEAPPRLAGARRKTKTDEPA